MQVVCVSNISTRIIILCIYQFFTTNSIHECNVLVFASTMLQNSKVILS
jgi:hypothetical protein